MSEFKKDDLVVLVGEGKHDHWEAVNFLEEMPTLQAKELYQKLVPAREKDSFPLELPPAFVSPTAVKHNQKNPETQKLD